MHRIIYYERTDSTNRRLKLLAPEAENGLTIIADEQTDGRGRLDRKWLSGPGEGAWFSVLVKDSRLSGENAAGMVFVCALAAARALRKLTGREEILVKWPNDIVMNGKKLAGILCESGFEGNRPAWIVCGIGINLCQTSFDPSIPWAGSVLSETGLRIDRNETVHAFLEEFDIAIRQYLESGPASVLKELEPLSATLGRRVRAQGEQMTVSGTAVGFAEDGSLLIDTGHGLETVRVGDVSVRGIMGYV